MVAYGVATSQSQSRRREHVTEKRDASRPAPTTRGRIQFADHLRNHTKRLGE